MSGYCEVDFGDASGDAEPVDFVNRRTVKARKPHTCAECHGLIAVGESHETRAYRFEGEFHAERVCAPCQEAAGEFGWHILGGSLWVMFQEEWDGGANVQGCINRLTTARAKEHMRQQWAAWQERRHQQRLTVLARRKAGGAVAGTAD